MNGEHLQISEIALFRKGSLSREEIRQASRHLLTCSDCRDLLPKPSREEFLRSLFVEQDSTSEKLGSASSHGDGPFSFFNGFRQTLQPIAVVALLMILTGGLSFLIFLEPSAPTDGNLIASVENSPSSESDQILPAPGTDIYLPPDSDRMGGSKQETGLTKQGQAIKAEKPKGKPSKLSKLINSIETQTRSVDGPCGFKEPMHFETSSSDDGIRLTWGKVTDASKYSVYISDLEEKLVDQFETDKNTFYVSKAKFERGTVYKWRLVITLNSGETIVGDAQNFSLNGPNENKDTQRNFQPHRRKSKNIRCTEKN